MTRPMEEIREALDRIQRQAQYGDQVATFGDASKVHDALRELEQLRAKVQRMVPCNCNCHGEHWQGERHADCETCQSRIEEERQKIEDAAMDLYADRQTAQLRASESDLRRRLEEMQKAAREQNRVTINVLADLVRAGGPNDEPDVLDREFVMECVGRLRDGTKATSKLLHEAAKAERAALAKIGEKK